MVDTNDKVSTKAIRDDYKLENVLGKGSFATVRKARDRVTGESVAVKIISKGKLSAEDKIALQNEIDILRQVDHPNIVKLINIYQDNSYYYLVMELMEGGELFDMLMEKEIFTEKEARDIIAPIIDAIKYCHSLDIVHRDIKPENLLLSSKDPDLIQVKVADFGLARFVGIDTLAQTTCGTPGYVAPEILMQKPYGKECDFWSIGVVLYILLSGMPPFYHEDNFMLFEIIKKCAYDFDDPSWEEVSEGPKEIIKKLLVADPSKRMTCDQLLKHPWITGNKAARQESNVHILAKMREWNSKRKVAKKE